MRSSMRRFGYASLLAGVAAVALASSAYSSPFVITDQPGYTGTSTQDIYWGATGYPGYTDVIGVSPPFGIQDAVITRTGSGLGSFLTITINTNFAGAPGTPAADGTAYGSLFLNPLSWSVTGSGPNHTSDNWVNGNQSWAYAVTTPTGTGQGPQMTGLYAIGAVNPVPVDQPSTTVPKYYTTGNGKVYMSYTANTGGNGDPNQVNATPVSGSNGWGWRQGQAVQYIPTNPTYNSNIPNSGPVAGTSVLETISNGISITYTITDNGSLGDIFGLAWAMTCANDVIQGLVNPTSNTALTPTPLPAALPMFTAGLGMMGLLGWRRKRKNAAALAAA